VCLYFLVAELTQTMTIVMRHMVRNYLLGCLPVLLALGALFSFLSLTEELEDVGKGFFQTSDAILVTLLTLPSRLLDLLPVTLLLGGLFGLGTLARHQEIIVLRAVGISLTDLARPLMVVAAITIVVVVGLRFYLIPDLELRAVQIRAKTEDTEITRDRDGVGYWMRTGNQLLHIGQLVDGHLLTGIEVYYLDSNDRVDRMMQAERGDIIADKQWLLSNVEEYDFRGDHLATEARTEKIWSSQLSDQQTASLVVPVEALSTADLFRYIGLLKSSGLDSKTHRIIFWQQISHLLAIAIMSLLSLPFILGIQRGGALAKSAIIGGVLGLGFYLLEQLMGHLSMLLGIAPALAACLPEMLMALLTFVLLRRADSD
jgi:lipopolysaccharide export system permease protein